MTQHTDVVVVGGGQAGLAAGYHLRRQGLDFVVLDADPAPGGSWQYMWDSLRLFSAADHSSLPGRLMPAQPGETYPGAGHVVAYLSDYEKRYGLPVQHGTRVDSVRRDGDGLVVETDTGTWRARAVISATGTWSRPFVPAVPGRGLFTGRQLHTVNYRGPADFTGPGGLPAAGRWSVIVVGGGNSGAQIAADLALDGNAEVTWVTRRPPRFLPDDIDGRALFDVATALHRSRLRSSPGDPHRALDQGRGDTGGVASLGDIVAVPPVRAARDAGRLSAKRMFAQLTATGARWADGSHTRADAIVWCTGFRPALAHLAPLDLRGRRGHITTDGTRALGEPRLHLLGYGDWTGPASATLIGVGRPARDAARAIARLLGD